MSKHLLMSVSKLWVMLQACLIFRFLNPSGAETRIFWENMWIPWLLLSWLLVSPGPWFNIMMSYQYRKSHCGDKTVIRSSYLLNGISYTSKMSSLYWVGAQVIMSMVVSMVLHMQYEWVLVFNDERFQLPAQTQCWEIIKRCRNRFLCFLKHIQHVKG